jgi:hypothetical protein
VGSLGHWIDEDSGRRTWTGIYASRSEVPGLFGLCGSSVPLTPETEAETED